MSRPDWPGAPGRRLVVKRPVVDQTVCIGCGLCTQIAENTFRMNDEELAEVFDPQGDDEQTIEEAISSCPVSCISWEEG